MVQRRDPLRCTNINGTKVYLQLVCVCSMFQLLPLPPPHPQTSTKPEADEWYICMTFIYPSIFPFIQTHRQWVRRTCFLSSSGEMTDKVDERQRIKPHFSYSLMCSGGNRYTRYQHFLSYQKIFVQRNYVLFRYPHNKE